MWCSDATREGSAKVARDVSGREGTCLQPRSKRASSDGSWSRSRIAAAVATLEEGLH